MAHFCITECVNKVVYCLALPLDAQIHNVFHVSLLKKCMGAAHATIS